MIALQDLLVAVAPIKIMGNTDMVIQQIEFDSRKLMTDSLFVATKGTAVDGHSFIPTAIEKGAKVIVCEDLPQILQTDICYIQVADSAEALGYLASAFYGYPSEKLTLVGVTGTNGKTTIATLLYELFKTLGYKVGLLSTVCNYIDEEVVEATHTTPDAISINQLLQSMVNAGCTYAFMEVSSHAIEQKRIAGLDFDGGIFTNLTRDHMDYHQTFENYLKAKKAFFDMLPAESFALTNIDDKNGMVMLQNCEARKFSYSMRTMADFKVKILEHSFDGMLLQVNGTEVHVPFIGKFNAANLVAVYGAAMLLDVDAMETLRILSMLKAVAGRFETIAAPAGFTAIVDYAHTPDALNNVLATINQILQGEGRLITVVGCGGDRDKGKRPMMAKEAVEGSWKAIFTSDNPRFEDPQSIIDDMKAGLETTQKADYIAILDRREAIKTACVMAQKGDVVLVAGKGHEDYQIIQGVKYHFSDKEEILAAIEK